MKRLISVILSAFILSAMLFGCNSYKELSSDDAQDKINSNKDIIVVDVRTPEEYAGGHLPNAINIDVNGDKFLEGIQSLDKNGDYIIYCFVGVRSLKAIDIMKAHGFKNVYNLKDGIKNWKGPVE